MSDDGPSMANLWDLIREAVSDDRYLVSLHADERCEERGISDWQVLAGVIDGVLLEERPLDEPNPSVVSRQSLADGTEIEVVWSWSDRTNRAILVTVYFPDWPS